MDCHNREVIKKWKSIWESQKKEQDHDAIIRRYLKSLYEQFFEFNNSLYLLVKNSISREIEKSRIIRSDSIKILEAGSGGGKVSLKFAEKGANVMLVDISWTALCGSKNHVKKIKKKRYKKLGKVNYVCANIYDMPFRDQEFDIVWNAGVIEHFLEKDQCVALAEMVRVCRKEGKVISLNPYEGGRIYKFGKAIAEKRKTWEYGYEKPISTLKPKIDELSKASVDHEYSIGFLFQTHFLKYLFKEKSILFYLFAALVELLNKILPFMNRLPGYLLVTVISKNEP